MHGDGLWGAVGQDTHAMCVLLQRGWFVGQEPWCVSGDCPYGDHRPLSSPPCRAEHWTRGCGWVGVQAWGGVGVGGGAGARSEGVTPPPLSEHRPGSGSRGKSAETWGHGVWTPPCSDKGGGLHPLPPSACRSVPVLSAALRTLCNRCQRPTPGAWTGPCSRATHTTAKRGT